MKNKIVIISMAAFLLGISLWCWLKPTEEYSFTERRYLKQLTEITWENFLNTRFMSDFDSYTQDQFPLRDEFRSIKSVVAFFGFGRVQNNDLYVEDGYIGKIEYPYNPESVANAAKIFGSVYERFLKDSNCNVYYSIIPDKNYFLAENSGTLSMNYELLVSDMQDNMSQMTYIDIVSTMQLEDFYKTDTHWRQEEIVDVAKVLVEAMGGQLEEEYTISTLEKPFYGVYYGQLALPMEGEPLHYLEHEMFEDCRVYDYTAQKEMEIYDMEKADGADPYEIYLSGPLSLITIENPEADTDKELIVFRDSFGSSIAPLFVEEYSKITLVDIRYMFSGSLGQYIEFENQDVLFLYSTMVLNHSETLK